MPWARGSHVVVRDRPEGMVGYTFPAVVVRDEPDLTVLFQPMGTICKRVGGPRGGPTRRYLLSRDGTFVDVVFDRQTVHAHVPGDAFWVIRDWDGARYVGWYINLSAPWTRTSIGFDMEDHKLDSRWRTTSRRGAGRMRMVSPG